MQHWLQRSSFQTLHYLLPVLAPFPWPFSSTKWRNSRPKFMNSNAPRPRIMEQVNHDFTSTFIHFVLKYIYVNWVCFLLHMIKIAPSFLMQMTWRMSLFLESTKLPSQDIFGKSLYTFYIGQNDFTSNLAAIGIGGVKQYLPQVVSQIAGTIKVNYLLIMQTNKNGPAQYLSCYLIGWKGSPLALFCTNPMPFLVGPFKASPIYIFIFYKEVLPHVWDHFTSCL